MGRGGYLGGSTLIGPGSSWFSKPKQPKTMTKAELLKQDRIKTEQKRQNQEKEALAEKKAKEKAERKRALALKEQARRAERARLRQEAAEHRKNDPEVLARVAGRQRMIEARMTKIVVEIKRPKRLRSCTPRGDE